MDHPDNGNLTKKEPRGFKIKKLMDLSELNKLEDTYSRQDYLIDEVFNNVKIFFGVLLLFIVSILSLWSGWNIKNMLKIDLFEGPHHDSIEDINELVGM